MQDRQVQAAYEQISDFDWQTVSLALAKLKSEQNPQQLEEGDRWRLKLFEVIRKQEDNQP